MTKSNKLDQFYTTPAVAELTARWLTQMVEAVGLTPTHLLEPSAGTGTLLEAGHLLLPEALVVGGDLEPKHPLVSKVDFLSTTAWQELSLPSTPQEVVTFANPPFGKKGSLALAFLEKALEGSALAGFILPLQFRRYLTQRKLPPEARLLFDEHLPKNSFVAGGKPYHVNCCFQVWTKEEGVGEALPDLRQRTAPPLTHPAYDAWIYNATPQTLKVFQEPWELAVLRQGWDGFTPHRREELPEPNRRQQWLLLRGKTAEATSRLLTLDYDSLAAQNTSVKGFGKADLVKEYTRLYGPA